MPPDEHDAVMSQWMLATTEVGQGVTMIEHTTGGKMSLAQLAEGHKSQPSTILRLTAEHSPGGAYPANVAAYINGVFHGTISPAAAMPAGLHLYLP
jgi:hypothetical protein